MKEIRAVLRPARLEALREAFRKRPDFPGMTVTRAQGSGYHPGKPRPPGIKGELTDYAERVLIVIVAPEADVAALLDIIHGVGHTGQAGDGVAWVVPVESFQRLREPPREESGT
jgi:nitrogen regulatory protein P-II 1